LSGGILYTSYDGVLEPLGQSQVLAYLERLAVSRPIHLLSFEKPKDWANKDTRAVVQERLVAAGIEWHPRRYHQRPTALATGWDIGVGIMTGLWLILRHRLHIVHARSYVPAVMALVLKRLTRVRFVFDMRGFWADERVDGGLWPRDGRLFKVAKWFEQRFLLGADHVVSLTRAGVREMQSFDYLQGRMPPVTVIPTCADLDKFKPVSVQRDAGFVLGYVGTTGTWYLFDATVACFAQLLELRPDSRFLIINQHEHDYIRNCLEAGGVPPEAVELRSVTHGEVPFQVARMDAAAFFIKPVFSKQASAPTKLGEFLGCGVPCLVNSGVGDMAEILEVERVGVAVESMDRQSLEAGLERLLTLTRDPDIRRRCVAAARANFSLDDGVRRYQSIYEALELTN